MDLSNAQNALALRLFEWSLRDLMREMREGCPLMSLVGLNNRYVMGFVEWVKTLSTAEQEALAKMLVRRAHDNAAKLRGETLSGSEQKRFNMEFFQQVSSREMALPALISADKRLSSFEPIDPIRCLEHLLASLPPTIGTVSRRGLNVKATRVIGDWKLVTEFSFYKPDEYLFCEHQFIRKDDRSIVGHSSPYPRNLFMLYGVTDTKVSLPAKIDCERMTNAMIKIAAHLVVEVEPLLYGLGLAD